MSTEAVLRRLLRKVDKERSFCRRLAAAQKMNGESVERSMGEWNVLTAVRKEILKELELLKTTDGQDNDRTHEEAVE